MALLNDSTLIPTVPKLLVWLQVDLSGISDCLYSGSLGTYNTCYCKAAASGAAQSSKGPAPTALGTSSSSTAAVVPGDSEAYSNQVESNNVVLPMGSVGN